VEILEILEERRSIVEPPAGKLAIREALVEITAAESVTPPEIALEDVIGRKVNSSIAPTVEVSSVDTATIEATSIGVTYTEVAPAMMINTKVTAADTSTPSVMIIRVQQSIIHMLFLIPELLQKP